MYLFHELSGQTDFYLLWNAITQYASQIRIQYLFGCGSLHTSKPDEVQPIYSYLRKRYFSSETFRVHPLASCRMPVSDDLMNEMDERAVSRKLSPILKGYLRAGAMICGAPALDEAFGTADVFVLLEMQKLATRYKQHYRI